MMIIHVRGRGGGGSKNTLWRMYLYVLLRTRCHRNNNSGHKSSRKSRLSRASVALNYRETARCRVPPSLQRIPKV